MCGEPLSEYREEQLNMIPGDFLVCKKADKRNLLTVGKRYVVKLHWASYVDILLPPTWATFEMENFYTVDEYREIKLNDLGI